MNRPVFALLPVCASLLTLMVVMTAAPGEAEANRFRGPDESPWHFRGDFGLPAVSLKETSFAFALELGYFGESFIIGYDLAQSVYSQQQGETSNDNIEFSNNFVLGYRTGEAGEFRHNFLLETNLNGFSTNYTGADFNGSSESSFLSRQSIVYGYTSPEDEDFFWGIFGGYGFQAESYDKITFSDDFGGDDDDASELNFSGFLLARGVARYNLWPNLMTVSAISELHLFNMTRSKIYFGDVEGGDGIEELTGVRLHNRISGEIVNFEALGLHPLAFVGLDVFLASGSSTQTNLTPVFGIGLTN